MRPRWTRTEPMGMPPSASPASASATAAPRNGSMTHPVPPRRDPTLLVGLAVEGRLDLRVEQHDHGPDPDGGQRDTDEDAHDEDDDDAGHHQPVVPQDPHPEAAGKGEG